MVVFFTKENYKNVQPIHALKDDSGKKFFCFVNIPYLCIDSCIFNYFFGKQTRPVIYRCVPFESKCFVIVDTHPRPEEEQNTRVTHTKIARINLKIRISNKLPTSHV